MHWRVYIYIYSVHMFEGHPAITRWEVSRCEAIKGMMYQGPELQLLWCENIRHPGSDNIEVPSRLRLHELVFAWCFQLKP